MFISTRFAPLLFAASALVMANANAESNYQLPQYDDKIHEGVASCANSVCHGKATATNTTNVQLNEYRIWLMHDTHSLAYKVLLNDKSKAM
ncbi:MAG: hypothetical protein P1U57_14065, partial [Oleibacter sp.]|nr:hypothetical protein [Thalassolituus sp.]